MNANQRKWDYPLPPGVNSRSSALIRGFTSSFVRIPAIRGFRLCLLSAVVTATVIALTGTHFRSVRAQDPESEPEIDVQAAAGEPLGVGKIVVRFPPTVVRGQRPSLSDGEGRIFYPVFRDVGTGQVTAYFLFRGDRQLRLTLDMNGPRHTKGIPVKNPDAHKMMLARWWDSYSLMVREAAAVDAYPPQIENYLASMLARRFQRQLPDIVRPWSGQADVDAIFGTLLGAESVRLAMQKDTLLRKAETLEEVSLPLPTPVAPPAIEIPDVPGDVEIEPIARHVPVECFYLRCGSFANSQWLRTTVDTWGGNLRDLVVIRGLDYDIRGRLERQLALRETVLSKLLGDAVIADVALIGTDTFFREGAAIGVLFQARNGPGLAAAIGAQRQEALKADRAVSEKTVEIGGRKVSLLATQDNRVRSFYAVDGDFHLVTTSQTIVRRFFEAGRGTDALSDLKEFRYARTLMPLARKDTLFVYLSDPWFRLLVSPQYRVEMTRRMQSEGEIELFHLARLAARSEKQPAGSIDELVAGGFLPREFGKHSDGSRLVAGVGAVTDSLRGAKRSFLPVPDVAVTHVTPSEDKAYQEFSRMYLSQWQRVDPVIVGVKRDEKKTPAGRREKVILDVHISPYARQHYRIFAGWLGEPDKLRVASVKGNVIEGEVRIGTFSADPKDPRYRIFGGERDLAVPFVVQAGRVVPGPIGLDNAPLYIGNTPAEHGFLFDRDGNVPEGYSENTNRGWFRWARRFEGFLVQAHQKELLEEVTPQIRLEEAERPAQLRLRVADLAPTQTAAILNAYGYERARRTSAGNADFMHALIEQLHVPAASARETLREVLAATPVCPLRGEYKLAPDKSAWISTAWAQRYIGQEDRVPADFQSPFLRWFHGLDLEFSIDATTLTTHIELELAPQ
jgi:hypothetical protein